MRLAGILVSVMTVGTLAMVGCTTSTDEKEQPISSVSEVQGGATDSTHKFAVGLRSNSGLCSGALILPNLVATARHCVSASPELIRCDEDPEFGADKNEMYVTTNTSMMGGGSSAGWYKAKKIYRPADNHVCGNDIALIELEKPIPAAEAKPITPGIQRKMWDDSYFVPQFTAVGYGRTAPAGINGNAGAGTRRILGNIDVRCVPGSRGSVPDCPSQLNEAEFIGGDGICQGDSGSSAYDQASFDQGDPISFGVLSRGGASPDGTMCQGSIYSRFDAHRDFILAVAKEASANWTKYPEPSWTAKVDGPAGVGDDDDDSSVGDDDDSTSKPAKPAKADVGDACKRSKDCESGKCFQDADGVRTCRANCSEDEGVCGDGEVCSDGACVEAPVENESPRANGEDVATDTSNTLPASEAPATQTITTGGCSSTSGSTSSGMSWLVGLGLVIAAVRRKRSR